MRCQQSRKEAAEAHERHSPNTAVADPGKAVSDPRKAPSSPSADLVPDYTAASALHRRVVDRRSLLRIHADPHKQVPLNRTTRSAAVEALSNRKAASRSHTPLAHPDRVVVGQHRELDLNRHSTAKEQAGRDQPTAALDSLLKKVEENSDRSAAVAQAKEDGRNTGPDGLDRLGSKARPASVEGRGREVASVGSRACLVAEASREAAYPAPTWEAGDRRRMGQAGHGREAEEGLEVPWDDLEPIEEASFGHCSEVDQSLIGAPKEDLLDHHNVDQTLVPI